jgi:hypothetical protein
MTKAGWDYHPSGGERGWREDMWEHDHGDTIDTPTAWRAWKDDVRPLSDGRWDMGDGRRVKTAAVRGWYADPTEEPHHKHLREGGWVMDCARIEWYHPNGDCVEDTQARALYEAGARWSRTNGWWFWEVEGVHGQGHTANGTTSQALAWLAQQA